MAATETLERTEEETDELEDEQPAKPLEPNAEDGELFDKSQWESPPLALPRVDDEGIDQIAIKFSGTVLLNRSDPADVALFRRIKLGKDIELRVEGKCLHSGGKGATNRDGDLDVVVGEKAVRVHTVYIPAGGLD